MSYKRNWNTFGLSVLLTGLGLAIFGVILFKSDDLIYCLVAIVIGIVLSILGDRISYGIGRIVKQRLRGRLMKV